MSDLLVEFTIYILPKSANKEPTKYTEKSDQIFLQSIIYFFLYVMQQLIGNLSPLITVYSSF